MLGIEAKIEQHIRPFKESTERLAKTLDETNRLIREQNKLLEEIRDNTKHKT